MPAVAASAVGGAAIGAAATPRTLEAAPKRHHFGRRPPIDRLDVARVERHPQPDRVEADEIEQWRAGAHGLPRRRVQGAQQGGVRRGERDRARRRSHVEQPGRVDRVPPSARRPRPRDRPGLLRRRADCPSRRAPADARARRAWPPSPGGPPPPPRLARPRCARPVRQAPAAPASRRPVPSRRESRPPARDCQPPACPRPARSP